MNYKIVMKYKLGKKLKVGDIIGVWWGRDTITSIVPYNGSLAFLWEKDGGARIASLAINKIGMTIEPHILFEVY